MTSPPDSPGDNARLHYGWIIALTGMLTVFASLGLGRFALGMLLPAMGEGLNLSYEQMGLISSGNFLGYLIAALLSGHGVSKVGYRNLISGSLLAAGLSVMMVAVSATFSQVLIFYFLAGLGSGASNVPVMALTAHWFSRRQRGKASALMVAGNGLAIMLSGLVIPLIIIHAGTEGWRMGWSVIGGAIMAIAILSRVLLRDRPKEMGLRAIGADTAPMESHAAGTTGKKASTEDLWRLGAIYFLFGASYVIYATFLVTSLVDDRQLSLQSAGYHWFWIGALSLVFTPLLGILSDHKGRGFTLTAVFGMQACAYLLVSLGASQATLYLSLILFGVSTWSIPSIVAAAVSDQTPPADVVTAFGWVTLLFGIGQVAGPALAGLIAEQIAGFSASFLLAAFLAIIALGLSFSLPRTHGPH